MALSVSQHSDLPPPLRTRPVKREPTPEEARAERRQAVRDAIEYNLHQMYDQITEYCGPLNVRVSPEGYEEQLGLELHPAFTAHLEWYCSGQTEIPQHTELGRAFRALHRERPNLYAVILAHLEKDLNDQQIGEKFHIPRRKVGEMFDYGLDVLAGWLGAWRRM